MLLGLHPPPWPTWDFSHSCGGQFCASSDTSPGPLANPRTCLFFSRFAPAEPGCVSAKSGSSRELMPPSLGNRCWWISSFLSLPRWTTLEASIYFSGGPRRTEPLLPTAAILMIHPITAVSSFPVSLIDLALVLPEVTSQNKPRLLGCRSLYLALFSGEPKLIRALVYSFLLPCSPSTMIQFILEGYTLYDGAVI